MRLSAATLSLAGARPPPRAPRRCESRNRERQPEAGAGLRPAAYRRDTASLDGLVWGCHGGSPAAETQRRWETAARRRGGRTYLAAGALFPAWEGGRGGYDCEPLARTFGPHGESFTVVAVYSLVP